MESVSQQINIGGIIQFGNYDWRILDVQYDKALILAEDIIEKRAYDSSSPDFDLDEMPDDKYEGMKKVTWEICTLRKYLNGEFLKNFTKEEQQRIEETPLINNDNLWYESKGGEKTIDKIFLLSLEEADKYFYGSGDYTNKKRKDFDDDKIFDSENGPCFSRINDLKEMKKDGKAFWWLRSPGYENNYAAYVIGDCYIFAVLGYFASFSYGGVRPALWLTL